ncbi:DUF1848 family protein [Testudinibacter sp. P27/CKL/0425]
MIVNTGRRTDTVHYYSEWLLKHFEEGYVLSRNPLFPNKVTRYGIHSSACMTLEMLGNANGVQFRDLKHKGLRQGCHCIESRDIGTYDSCTSGCKYCYANKSAKKTLSNAQLHDPNSPLLLGHLKETDTMMQGQQKSFLANKQMDLIMMWEDVA